MNPPDHLQPAARRILDRVRRCAPATGASCRLFTQHVCEETIRSPLAGPDDARAARAMLDLIRTDPAALDVAMGGEQLDLFGGRGTP